MQDFLAGGGKGQGYYTELQVGPAPSQMQSFPLPKQSVRQWTEWFKAFQAADPSTVHAGAYPAALAEVDSWIRSDAGMTKEAVGDWDAFMQAESQVTPTDGEVVVRGSPWGAVEELLLGRPLAPGVRFLLPEEGTPAFAEAKPWMELVNGTFSAETLSRTPLSYQTTDRWLALLQSSAAALASGPTWLHLLHIAVGLAERGDVAGPRDMLLQSMSLHPTPVAARCLAVLSSTQEDAWGYYQKAWALLPSVEKSDSPAVLARLSANLVTEMSFFLIQAGWSDVMAAFAESVPAAYRGLDAYLLLSTKLALQRGAFAQAASILQKECFPTFAKARDDLMAMWNTCSEGLAQQKKGPVPLTPVEKHRARLQTPIPDNIGCQYASEYCLNYW